MLNCKLTSTPSSSPCALTVSGVKRMAIANWGDYTYTASGTDCLIDTINLGNENFYEVNFAEGSGYANANVNAGAFVDQKSVLHQVGGVLPMIDCDLSENWKNFLLARVIFAVETKSGQVFIFGAQNGLSATNFDYASGTAETDQNGITFLYEGSQTATPLLVSSWSIIEALYPTPTPVTPTSISFDDDSYELTINNNEGNVETIAYTVTNNLDNDVTADTTITLDSPLEGLTVANGGITFTVGVSTQPGEYTRTMTAHYNVVSEGAPRELTTTATITIVVRNAEP